MAATVVPFRQIKPKPAPTLAQLVAQVRQIAKNRDNLGWSDHFKSRLAQRGVTMRQVLDTLDSGDGVSARLDQNGDWRVKLRRLAAGRRVQVVVAVKGSRLSGVTVI